MKTGRASERMLDRFVETSRFYIKIDLGIIAAVGTLFTILQLNRSEIAHVLNDWNLEVTFLLGLLAFGLLIERILVFATDGYLTTAWGFSIVAILLIVQSSAHVFMAAYVASSAGRYSSSIVFHETIEEVKMKQEALQAQELTYKFVLRQISDFYSLAGRFPNSLGEIQKRSPTMFSGPDSVFKNHFLLNRKNVNTWAVTLAGPDDILYTSDDYEKLATFLRIPDTTSTAARLPK
jgi:hypothetical protein